MSTIFLVLISLLSLITLTFIVYTIAEIYYDGLRYNILKIIISLLLVVVTLLSIIAYVNVSHTITEKLPSHGTVEITLKDEDAFIDKANSKVEKFISKYISKGDVDIELKCKQTYYYIYIKDKTGETLDYYYSTEPLDIYLLLKNSTILNS